MSLRDRLAVANAAARNVADEGRTERQRCRDNLRADGERVTTDHAEHQAALRELRGDFERPTLTGPTAPQPPRSPLPSTQDHQPGGATPSPTLPPPAAPVNKSRRTWPWIVGATVLLLVIIGVANRGDKNSTSTTTATTPQTQAPAIPAQVTLPTNLTGNNAQLAGKLRKLGIVTISYTSQNTTDKIVPPLANWTVTKVEPAPGTVVPTTDTAVVTATKKANSIAQQPAPPSGAPTTTGQHAAHTTPAEHVETPSERTTVRPQHVTSQQNDDSSGSSTVYYKKNCDAARAAGAAPIKRGEPGYRPELDGDKDGTACDK